LHGGRAAPLATDATATLRRDSVSSQPVDAVVLEEWLTNPPEARMSASFDGLEFHPNEATLFLLPDEQRSATAVVFKRLAGDAYDRTLVERAHADIDIRWNAGRKPSFLRAGPEIALQLVAFAEAQTGKKAQVTPQQRLLLEAGEALSPVPPKIWNAMPPIVIITAGKSGFKMGEPNFLSRRQVILKGLAAVWWGRTQIYVEAYKAWRADPSNATLMAAGNALSNLINEFDPYADALRAIHDDAALMKETGWQMLWPPGKDGRKPLLQDINDAEAVAFTRYAASQPHDLIARLQGDAAARRSLLRGFVDFRGRLQPGDGDQDLSVTPSTYNAAPLPVRMDSYPRIMPPLFAAATGATTTFVANVRFPDMYEAMSHAFGGWFYKWEALRVPGDDIANLGNLTIPPETPSGWDVFKQTISRDVEYAEEDMERMRSISRLTDVFGPPGISAESLVAANLIMDVVGTVFKSLIRALTRPDQEFDVPFNTSGLYLIRCHVGPELKNTAQLAQFRRAPAVAWMPVYAQSPRSLAEDRARMEVAGRADAETRLADLRKQLAGSLPDEERARLLKEAEDLDLALHGNTLVLLRSQRAALDAQRARIEAGSPTSEDLGVSLSSLREQIKQLDLLIGMRGDRAKKLGAAPHRITAVLAKDDGTVISLTIEAALLDAKGPHWYVSDLTSPKSGHKDAVGEGKLAIGSPNEDSILAALKKLLESESGYGRGQLSVWFPPGLAVNPKGRLRTIRIATDEAGIAMHGIESISTLLSIAAVVAAPFTGGGSLVLLMPAGLIGAVPSAYRLIHRAEMGTLRFDLETAMQVLDIATAALQLGELGAGAKAVAKAGTKSGLRWAVFE
ncbi:MAG TPA: hypothetical protein VIL69_02620, partial [Roseomonas sp.]